MNTIGNLVDRIRFPQAFLIALVLHILLFLLFFLFGKEFLALATLAADEPLSLTSDPIRFTFVDLPDELLVKENPDAKFFSDANREIRSEEPPAEAEESDLPFSEGNSSMVEITPPELDGFRTSDDIDAKNQLFPEPPDPEPEPEETVIDPEETFPGIPEEPRETGPEPLNRQERIRQALREVLRLKTQGFDTKFENQTRPKISEFGGLSFDTKDFDWADYARRLIEIIRHNWRIPLAVQHGESGKCAFRFTIERDGRISRIDPVYSSGKAPLDNAANQALQASNPVPPLPANFPGERENVTIHFYYNMRVER